MVALAGGCTRRQPSGGQLLYMAIPQSRQVLVYAASASGQDEPLAIIQEKAPDLPVDVSVDGIGEIVVANQNGNIRVFGRRPDGRYEQVRFYAGYNTRMAAPSAVAVNRAGSFYVADPAGGHPRIEWFSGGANGNLVPDHVIAGPSTHLVDPQGLALDGAGRLYVADRGAGKILVFPQNSDGDAAPIAEVGGLRAPGRLAVDDVLDLAVVNQGDKSVELFTSDGPENWDSAVTLSGKDLSEPSGVAFDETGGLAVGTAKGVVFYPAGVNAQTPPLRTLRGRNELDPAGIFIH